MNILITGGNGFIGKSLALSLTHLGHHVFCGSRQKNTLNENTIYFDLREASKFSLNSQIDCIIHLAWSLQVEDMSTNVNGTVRLAQWGLKSGINKQIFFSSFSAHKDARSSYGKGKFATEKFFTKHNLQICRPGLVIGDGGIYQRLKVAATKVVIPLIDGGRDKVPTITEHTLCELLNAFLSTSVPELNAFDPELATLKELISKIAQTHHSKPLFLPIPSKLLLPILQIAETRTNRLPITSENILGLLSNRSSPHTSNTHLFSSS